MRLDWLPSDTIEVVRKGDNGGVSTTTPTRRVAMIIDLLMEVEERIIEHRQGWVEFYFDGRRVHCQIKLYGGVRRDRKGDAAYDPDARPAPTSA